MRLRLSVVVLAATLAWVAPGAAATLNPTIDPLVGSSFQGGDGNQANDSGFVDWQQLQTDRRVVHLGDPEPDSSFTGGSEENEPGGWGLTTGSVPNKGNILDVWSAVDQPSASTFLYFGFRRESVTGDAHVTFELNRDPELWNNGQADIPCRRDGDLAIAYNVSTNRVDISVQEWRTATTGARGCASTGSFTNATDIRPQDVQAAMSPAPIRNYLTGGPALFAGGAFGEAALNLAAVVEEASGDKCFAFGSIWMHTRSSTAVNSSLQDYVAPQPLAIRTCSASGTKFFDSNGNGARDPGEPGIPRFLIWADYDNDGIQDPDEPFSVTDDNGDYVIDDIHGTYRLREMLLDGRTRRLPFAVDWTCSFPTATAPGGRFPCAWGPIDPNQTPNARGHDFGDFYPARLVIRKNVAPPGDPTQFQVNITSTDGRVSEVVTIGDGQSVGVDLPPGTYNVEEVPPPGSDYTTSVTCRSRVAHRGTRRSSSIFSSITLTAGTEAECAFVNVAPTPEPAPAIQVVKTGPVTASAGDTLDYKLYVTNAGRVAFPASGVKVIDPVCDNAPKLVSKGGDSSPRRLDPGDTWTYTCSHATSSGGMHCKPGNVANAATVTGDTGTAQVHDRDTISTALVCEPPVPIPPNPTPEPQPIEPVNPDDADGPVEPIGPKPPDADDAGAAAIKVLGAAARGCTRSRAPRLDFEDSRVASVRIYVNGQLRRSLTLRTLQRRDAPRVRLPAGRYRITARVTFQPGSGTPPVTVTATVRICSVRAPSPRFTG